MPHRMSINIGAATARPWSAGVSAIPFAAVPTAAGGCTSAYGPVANVCQSSVPVTQVVPVTRQVPVTSVTPIPSMVAPQVSVDGMPMAGLPYGAAPWGKGAMAPYGKGAAMPYGKGAMLPYGKAVPVSVTTGLMPGLYTTDAWITGGLV